MKWAIMVTLFAVSFLQPVTPAKADFALYEDWESFVLALGGAKFGFQDFEGYAPGTNLNGVEFLPGVSVTSNMPNVQVFQSGSDRFLFAFGGTARQKGTAYYEINFTQDYNAIAFEIAGWDPKAPGPAYVEIVFRDGSTAWLDYYQTGSLESDPVFFGIISDQHIDTIRWYEGPEVGGKGNEEVAFDNFLIANLKR